MERPVGCVVGGEHPDRLLDKVGLVVVARLRHGAVERRQIRIEVHLGQSDVGPVVAGRFVDVIRLERIGVRPRESHWRADDIAHRPLAEHGVVRHPGVGRTSHCRRRQRQTDGQTGAYHCDGPHRLRPSPTA
jgi:hypothetical protein